MSDAKTPEQNPDPNQPAAATPSSWFAGWEEFSATPDVHAHLDHEPIAQPSPTDDGAAQTPPAPPSSDVWDEWQTVDFPNAMSVEAIERQSKGGDRHPTQIPDWVPETAHPIARTIPPDASPDTWTEPSTQADTQPNIGELISLIQELNQCNNALLDRVSQLEDALEHTQNATLAQNANVIQAIAPDSDDSHALHSQVVALSSQLNLSQQISQRQQVLAETLTQDLAASQARVAQLEHECALAQQRLNEQAQLLIQSESDCRDLRTRLQRQQRHTLQFKAALERCLDVPVDLAEAINAGGEATTHQTGYDLQSNLAVQSLLPKVQHIQPWSARSSGSSVPMKLDALISRLSEPAAEPDLTDLQPDPLLAAPEEADLAAPTRADMPPASREFPDLTPVVESLTAEVPSPPAHLLSKDLLSTEEVATHDGDLSDVFTPPAIPSVNDIIKTLLDPGAGSDAEATLWQDLARLVNSSTDEVPEANLTQEGSQHGEAAVNAPQSISQNLPQSISQNLAQNRADSAPEPVRSAEAPNGEENWRSAIAPGPLPIPPLVPTAATDKRKLLTIPFESSAWSSQSPQSAIATESGAAPEDSAPVNPEQQGPSPLVYPERPAKKIQSLAAVDLPSFPR